MKYFIFTTRNILLAWKYFFSIIFAICFFIEFWNVDLPQKRNAEFQGVLINKDTVCKHILVVCLMVVFTGRFAVPLLLFFLFILEGISMHSRLRLRSTENTMNAGPAHPSAQPSPHAQKVTFPGQPETSHISRRCVAAHALSPLQGTRIEVSNKPGHDIGVHNPHFASPLFWQTLE